MILFKQTQKEKEKKGAHLSRYISGEITVGSELEVAAISCLVVHHVYLSRLAQDKIKNENVLSVLYSSRLKSKHHMKTSNVFIMFKLKHFGIT